MIITLGSIFLTFNMNGVLIAGGVVGAVGLIIGILLGIAAKKLAVETDERISLVRECLPGSNCGGCGYAGCDACAEAIVKGDAPVNACPGGRHSDIASVMGTEAGESIKKVAYVRCSGTCDRTSIKYRYQGIADCKKLALIPGHGEKDCTYGCMGYGTCVKVCNFDAIHVVNGVARVSPDKCVGCGKCVSNCPNGIIQLVPADTKYVISCNSMDKGKDVKAKCTAGCLGCGICVKQCGSGAVTLENNLARIDYEKCTGCGACAAKCPAKVIKMWI